MCGVTILLRRISRKEIEMLSRITLISEPRYNSKLTCRVQVAQQNHHYTSTGIERPARAYNSPIDRAYSQN